MKRLFWVVALCAAGLTACGTDSTGVDETSDALESTSQGLACVTGSGSSSRCGITPACRART